MKVQTMMALVFWLIFTMYQLTAGGTTVRVDKPTSPEANGGIARFNFDVLDKAKIPDLTISIDLGFLKKASVVIYNMDIRVTDNSTGVTSVNDTTIHVMTTDLGLLLEAEWSAKFHYLIFNRADHGTFFYKLYPLNLNVCYSIESLTKVRQLSCHGDILFSRPTITSEKGYDDFYVKYVGRLQSDLEKHLKTQICRLLDPEKDQSLLTNLS